MNEPESEAARASARLGQVLRGKYRLDRVLGIGGMATVYAAAHRNGMEYAVKVLHAELTARPDIRARFVREGMAANAIHHPGAVKVVDDDVAEDGSAFLVMELLHGEPLDAVWDRCGRVLPIATILPVGVQLCDVLAAAHKAGVVHRDLKPQNLFLTVDGELKVLDFGIARLRDAGGASATNTGMMLGTPTYMSPEQAAGDTGKVGPCSDIYAAGATLFALASGLPVHEGENNQQIVVRAATTPARSLAVAMPQAPASLVAIVDRALAFDPAARWASAAAMRDALVAAHAEILGAVPASIPLPRLTGLAWFRNTSSPPASADVSTAVPVAMARRPPPPAPEGVPAPASGPPTARSTPATPPRKTRGRALAAVGAAIASMVALGVGVRARPRGAGDSADPRLAAHAAAAPPSASALAASTVPEAARAYQAGMQAEHDANQDIAQSSFLAAATADPGMGAAHLRYALAILLYEHAAAAHAHFLTAVGLRSSLRPVDAALLDAFAPVFEKQPPDWDETERRLVAAAKSFPTEAEVVYRLARVQLQRNEIDACIATTDAALALDPRFAGALFVKEVALQRRGDSDALIRVSDRCLEVAPQAAACLGVRIEALSASGQCAEVERSARQLIAINPDAPAGFLTLAEASFAQGRSRSAVLEALKNEWKNQREDAAWTEASDRAFLAALVGDEPELTRSLDTMDRIAGEGRDVVAHLNAAWTRVETLTELGRDGRAAAVAGDFLERRGAWEQDPGVDYQAIAWDMVPMMSKALERAGKISADELARRRDRWIEGWRARASPSLAGFLWIYGYAQIVGTPTEAREALAVLPQFEPLPIDRPSFVADAGIGRTYLLAGRAAEALPLLQRATRRCDPWEDPFAYVHASLWLGDALRAEGRKEEACAAYARVTLAWKGFGPRSVSVREARAKADALRCAGGQGG